MADPRLDPDYAEYVEAASAILSRHSGHDAVDAFGLHDVFASAPATTDYSPAYAFLEAQGQAAATTPALAVLGLAASPLPKDLAPSRGFTFGIAFGHDQLVAVPDFSSDKTVVIDRPGVGLVSLARPSKVPLQDPRPDDYVQLLDGSGSADVVVAEADFAGLRAAMEARIRLGISAEILGACSRLVDDAVAYARTRRQFGAPIGDYQAVQHLLAWAATDLHQLRCVFDIAVHQAQTEPSPATARAVKAIAGRAAHSVAQAAIQTTGAISFTWEYSLNRFHHRLLVLDQLAGPSADLIGEIGRQARLDGVVPDLFTLGELPQS